MSLFNEQKRQEIINRINQLTPQTQPLWGKMDVNQMLCHTADQFRIALGEREIEKFGTIIDRTIIKWLILYAIDIPKDVPTSPKVNPFIEGTQPTNFADDRQTLLNYINELASKPAEFQWSEDIKFGKVTGWEWSRLTYKHLHHHLKQFGV